MTDTAVEVAKSADVVQTETLYKAKQLGGFTQAEVAGIDARVRHDELPWWRRWREGRPPSWEQIRRGAR